MGGVVNAIAGHYHDAAFLSQLPDAFVFALRLDTELFSDSFGGALVVAGEQDDFQVKPMQLRNGLRASMALWIGQGQNARKAAPDPAKMMV